MLIKRLEPLDRVLESRSTYQYYSDGNQFLNVTVKENEEGKSGKVHTGWIEEAVS